MGIELTPEEQNTLIDSWGNSPLSLKEIVGKVAEAQLKKLQDLASEQVVEEIAKLIHERCEALSWEQVDDYYLALAREFSIFKVVERENESTAQAFLRLPVEERYKILKQEVNNPEIIKFYIDLVDSENMKDIHKLMD